MNYLFMQNLKSVYKIIFVLLYIFLIAGNLVYAQAENNSETKFSGTIVNYAGVRSSSYGIRPFPNAENWTNAMKTMGSYFEGSTPSAIWIVGELSREKGCRLFFTSAGKAYEHIIFNEEDKHEAFLNHFDTTGVKVFLQIEPGNGDVPTLIDLVLSRYKHHPCVVGFGIDVEWYRESEKPGWGIPVTDTEAEEWERKIKSYNKDYRLFLKHWDPAWMPPSFRGEIIFVDDSQMFEGIEHMVKEFQASWAPKFKPNPVFFQIGYRGDNKWWKNFENPPKYLGEKIIEKIEQPCGIFWVDFSLRDVRLIPE